MGAICVLFAFIGMLSGMDGWGWFIFLAIILEA